MSLVLEIYFFSLQNKEANISIGPKIEIALLAGNVIAMAIKHK